MYYIGVDMKYTGQDLNFIVIADTHDAFSYYYPEKMLKSLNYWGLNIDCIVLLGDHSQDDLKTIRRSYADMDIFGVVGNHDCPEWYKKENIEEIHLTDKSVRGYRFAGLHGCLAYKPDMTYCFSQEESIELSDEIPECNILITHDCYYRKPLQNPMCNEEYGLKGLSTYINAGKCDIHLHGHQHEDNIVQLKDCTSFGNYLMSVFRITNNPLDQESALIRKRIVATR